MSTTLKSNHLEIKKYILRSESRSAPIGVTAILSQAAFFLLANNSNWEETSVKDDSEFGSHSDVYSAKNLEIYDAYNSVGSYVIEGRTQKVYAGAALYRVKLPTAAAGIDVEGLSFAATICRYSAEGARVQIWRSAVSTPSETWKLETITEAGVMDSPNVGAPPVDVFPAVAHTTETISFAPIAATFDTGDYVWVLLTMEDYGSVRDTNWVEGAIASAMSTTEIVVDADFTPLVIVADVENEDDPLGFPSYVSDTKPCFKTGIYEIAGQMFIQADVVAAKYSLSPWIGINEAFTRGKTTVGGGESEVGFIITTKIYTTTTPKKLMVGRLAVNVSSLPFAELSGLNLYLFPTSDQLGETAVRIFVISDYGDTAAVVESDIRKSWDTRNTNLPKSFYDGTNSYFLGTKSVKNHKYADKHIVIPLTKNIVSEILASSGAYGIKIGLIFEHLDSRDIALPVVGFDQAFYDVAVIGTKPPNEASL